MNFKILFFVCIVCLFMLLSVVKFGVSNNHAHADYYGDQLKRDEVQALREIASEIRKLGSMCRK